MLDTSACVGLIRGPAALAERLCEFPVGEVTISSITVAELLFGVERSQQRERNRQALALFLAPLTTWAFDNLAAEAYGRLRQALSVGGIAIGGKDLLIAAHAQSRGARLITLDGDFARIDGLTVVRW